jgi:hypothetical protein
MKTYLSLHRILRLISFALVVALLLAANAAAPRNVSASDVEWRPIEASDLALKAPIVEPDADAEAIFWDIRVDDGGDNDLVLSHYIRIKIFTERGRDRENKIDIPFVNGTKIKDIAARTIKPDGSIIELAKTDVVENTVVKVSGLKLKTKSFVFPSIEPGAIIEYRWKEVISNASASNMRLEFQREIPVQSITYHIKPADSAWSFEVYPFNMPRPEFQKEAKGFQYVTVTKMPAFHEEPFMPPEENVRSWAMLKYHNLYTLLRDYEFVAASYYTGWKQYLKVDDDIKRKSAEIVAGATTPDEKLQRIFEFVRTNIKNTNDQSSGFTSDEIEKLKENKKPADTLKRGVGPGIDVNLLFAALANAAGFEARIALLPDRGKRFFKRDVNIPNALRPSNIAVRFGTYWKFFDPGFHYVSTDMLRWQEEGVSALIVDETPTWTMTPISLPEKSKSTRTATLRLEEDGTLEGDIIVEETGHLAIDRKEEVDDESPNEREETLKRNVKERLGTAEISNIVFENVTDPVKPFIYKYHIRVPEYAQRTGKRLFVQPGYFEKGVGALFTAGTRKYSLYFHYPWSEEDKITITLPKVYAPDNADAPAIINVTGICHHEVKMRLVKGTTDLVYTRNFFFGNDKLLLFPVHGYSEIKRLFDAINKPTTTPSR